MAINIPITSTFDDTGLNKAQKALTGISGPASSLGNILKASVVPGLIAAAGSVLVFTKGLMPAIEAASDLQENTSKISVIFGEAGKAVTEFAKTAARDIGQSQNQVLEAAGTFGTFGKAAGLAGEQLATFTTDFITLSADLASFNNTTPDEAINAIGAALRGEAEPLRRFGVLLNDATLKAAALELGIYSGSGALTAQQKILAAQKVIYEQTGDAQGDFARTSDGLANQQRILSAQFENVKTKIGTLLLPVFSELVKFLNEQVLPSIDRVITAFGEQGLGRGLQQAVAETGSAGEGLVKAFKFIALNAAKMANVVYSSVQILIAQFQFLTGSPLEAIKTAAKAFDTFIDIGALEKSFDTFSYKVNVLQGAVLSQNKTILDAEKRLDSFGKVTKKTAEELAGAGADEEKGLSGAAKKVTKAIKEASEALNKEMAQALDGAKQRLEKSKKAFDDYANSVANVISTALNFGKAFEEGGEDAGLTFFSALQKQADKAKEFASLVEQLLAKGLSQEALQQVIDAGVDSGAAIAKELLQSSENVLRANKLVAETNKIAEQIGLLSASNFYAAGISNAQQYLAGVEAAMAEAQARLAKKGIKLADVKGISANFANAVSVAERLTMPKINPLPSAQPVNQNQPSNIVVPTMPRVIPVGAPTDKGLPLGNVTINVNSELATKAEVGEAVNDALRAYNRLSGPLQLQIA